MNSIHLAGAALTVAGLSLALSAWSISSTRADAALASAAGLAPTSDPRVPELRAELSALRGELRGLTEGIQDVPRVAPTGEDAGALRAELELQQTELAARLEALQARVDGMEGNGREELGVLGFMFEPEGDRLSIEEAAALATASTSSEEEQISALRTLRGQRLEDGNDARDPAVVQAMVDLYHRSENPDVRADVFRQMHGVSDPALRQPLLDALSADADAGVRSEAAETLDHYLDDPAVRAALEYAAEHDTDGDVREQARESLGGGESWKH